MRLVLSSSGRHAAERGGAPETTLGAVLGVAVQRLLGLVLLAPQRKQRVQRDTAYVERRGASGRRDADLSAVFNGVRALERRPPGEMCSAALRIALIT